MSSKLWYPLTWLIQEVETLRDQHRLVLSILDHGLVGTVSNGEQVRWHLVPSLTTVLGHNIGGVDRKAFVGVDYHTEETGVGLQGRNKVTWRGTCWSGESWHPVEYGTVYTHQNENLGNVILHIWKRWTLWRTLYSYNGNDLGVVGEEWWQQHGGDVKHINFMCHSTAMYKFMYILWQKKPGMFIFLIFTKYMTLATVTIQNMVQN